jgi:hypothetical protein
MTEEIVFACTAEPPHHLRLVSRTATPRGISLRLSDADDTRPSLREVFVTKSELSMGYDPIYKACFLCVDIGRKEKAFPIPVADIE